MSADELAEALEAVRRVAGPDGASACERLARLIEARDGDLARTRGLLARTVKVATARGVAPVAEEVLDGMIGVLDAERGFLGLGGPDDWRLVAARRLASEDVEDARSNLSHTLVAECLRTRQPVVETNAVGGRFADQRSVHKLRLRSVMVVPLGSAGFVYLDDTRRRGVFDAAAIAALEAWLPLASEAVGRAIASERDGDPFPGFATRCRTLRDDLEELLGVARFDAPVLLTGETGTGKTALARAVHLASRRASAPFVHLNCGAIPENLLEGELFGTTKGAYTGAVDREGRFEAASGGTLFLDELDSMPLSCQVKLLVAVQEGWVTRLGANERLDVDVRIVSAMNSDPFARMADGELREDLFYRLAVVHVHLPPLRARPEDILLLAGHTLARTRARYGTGALTLADEALQALLQHSWPGNVRELENVLDRAALTARDGVIARLKLLGPSASAPAPLPVAVEPPRPQRGKVEATEFLAAWTTCGGSVERTADRLGITTRSVFRLKKRFGA